MPFIDVGRQDRERERRRMPNARLARDKIIGPIYHNPPRADGEVCPGRDRQAPNTGAMFTCRSAGRPLDGIEVLVDISRKITLNNATWSSGVRDITPH
jgi:hypothetical protein